MRTIARTAGCFLLAGTALSATGATAQEPYQWSGRIAEGRSIEIKGVNGGIRAIAASGPEARVTATRSAKRSDPSQVRFEMIEHARGVTICAVYPHPDERNECRPGEGGRMRVENNDVEVDWVVHVPRGVHFIGRTINGAIHATGLPADAEARTVNGAITISAAGIARANTVNGDIDVAMGQAGWARELRLQTVNGDITATFAGELHAQVSATAVNGEITSDYPLETRGRFGPRRLTGTVGQGGRELSLNTVNGSISLRRR